ncbi:MULTISPECIES: hypothetical protein [unclassified Rickettsia]
MSFPAFAGRHCCVDQKTHSVSYRGLSTVSRKNLNQKTGCRDQVTA